MMRLTATTARGRNGKDDRRCEYRNRSLSWKNRPVQGIKYQGG